jgi:hypothetical protein
MGESSDNKTLCEIWLRFPAPPLMSPKHLHTHRKCTHYEVGAGQA